MTTLSTTHILAVDNDEIFPQAATESGWSLQDYLVQMAGRIARMAREQPSSLNMLLLPPLEGAETFDVPTTPDILEDDHVPAVGVLP